MKKITWRSALSFLSKKIIYIIDVITFISAIIAIVLNEINATSPTITLVICVISFGLSLFIKDGYSKKQYDLLKKLNNGIRARIEFNTIATERKNLDRKYLEMLENGNEVFISGSSLVRVADNLEQIISKLSRPCKLQFVIVQPGSSASKIMAKYIANKKEANYDEQIRNSIAKIRECVQAHAQDPSDEKITVSLHQLPCCPPLGFVRVKKNNSSGIVTTTIKAEVYSLSDNYPERINIVCDADDKLFDFFNRQIDGLLSNSREISTEKK